MYNDNRLRLIKKLDWKENEIDTLEKRMSVLPEDARHIIEVRWGLNGNEKICPNFVTLDKKLGVENSRRLYHQAIWKLQLVPSYYELLIDGEDYTFEESVGLGRLATNIFLDEKLQPKSISGKKLEKKLGQLSYLDEKIIRIRFFDNEPITLEDVGRKFELTTQHLWKAEEKILKKLRKSSKKIKA